MTYLVAWRTKRTFYISTDSAVTVEGDNSKWQKSSDPVSSINERHIYEQNRIVEEAILKVHNLNNEILIGYAGDVEKSVEIIQTLKLKLLRNTAKAISDLFQDSISEILDSSNDCCVSLALGTIVNGSPLLISYNGDSTSAKIRTDESIIQLGSMTTNTDITERTEVFIKKLIELEAQGTDEEHFLISINAFLQSNGIHNVLMELGVGGIITGAKLDINGVQWQKDSNYYLVNPKIQIEKFTNLIFRNNGAIMRFSAGYLAKALFTSTSSNLDYQKIVEETYLNRIETNLASSYHLFFLIKNQRVVVISKKSNLLNNWFTLKTIDVVEDEVNTTFQMAMSKSLFNILNSDVSEGVEVLIS